MMSDGRFVTTTGYMENPEYSLPNIFTDILYALATKHRVHRNYSLNLADLHILPLCLECAYTARHKESVTGTRYDHCGYQISRI